MKKKDRQPGGSPKRTDNRTKKGPTTERAKGPTNYRPVVLLGVMDGGDLVSLLHRSNQKKWGTPKRVAGLLLLVGFILKKGGKTVKISSELAHHYVGRLKGSAETIAQPLALLIHVGILEMVRPAKVGPHAKVSAEYRIHPNHRRRCEITVEATPGQIAKLYDAENRNERRMNRKHRFRARLIEDIERVTLSDRGRAKALELLVADEKKLATIQALESLDGSRGRRVGVDKVGTIRTFINAMPRELKPHLEIDGAPSVKRDLDGAHFCVLQRVLRDRTDYLRGIHPASPKIPALDAERARLAAVIASGDIYRRGADVVTPAERKRNKKEMLSALNMRTAVAIHVLAYQWFRAEFPLTCGIIEDIKAKDHRTLSMQLQNYTARVINGALIEVQSHGIPAFPDTDALIVPASASPMVDEVLNRWLRDIVGEGRVSAA